MEKKYILYLKNNQNISIDKDTAEDLKAVLLQDRKDRGDFIPLGDEMIAIKNIERIGTEGDGIIFDNYTFTKVMDDYKKERETFKSWDIEKKISALMPSCKCLWFAITGNQIKNNEDFPEPLKTKLTDFLKEWLEQNPNRTTIPSKEITNRFLLKEIKQYDKYHNGTIPLIKNTARKCIMATISMSECKDLEWLNK